MSSPRGSKADRSSEEPSDSSPEPEEPKRALQAKSAESKPKIPSQRTESSGGESTSTGGKSGSAVKSEVKDKSKTDSDQVKKVTQTPTAKAIPPPKKDSDSKGTPAVKVEKPVKETPKTPTEPKKVSAASKTTTATKENTGEKKPQSADIVRTFSTPQLEEFEPAKKKPRVEVIEDPAVSDFFFFFFFS